ncbi:MAG: hypothetical protein WCT18_03135 [Patescibacteria group bacterium]
MMENLLNQRTVLAVIIILAVYWIAVVLFRVVREKSILQTDFWKSKWKIVLFWFIFFALVVTAWYFYQKYRG